jgi:sugar/nucleoside kinase (ribokinase family)
MPQFDVTLAGELNLDLILYGLPEQLEPERELLADRMALTLGGSSAIFAHNLAALGTKVGFVSKIGEDAMGTIALEKLSEGGVDVSCVRRASNLGTGLSVILQHPTWRNILTHLGTISELRFEDLDLDYLKSSRHFHLSSFFLQTALQPRIPELFQILKGAGLTLSMDTNDDPDDTWQGGLKDVLRYLDVFMPNEREARRITGTEDRDAAIARLAEIVPLVVVKMGAKGAIARRGRETFTSPGINVEPLDAVGAGDSFDSGFISQYVRGADLGTCLQFGNLSGAFSTTRAGGTEAFRDRQWREKFFRERG